MRVWIPDRPTILITTAFLPEVREFIRDEGEELRDPATAPAYAHKSIADVFDRSPQRPRAPLSLGIPNGTALDRLSATRQASSQSTEYLNVGGL